MEQDGPVKSVILSGQKKVSAPPPLEPGEASGTPQAVEPARSSARPPRPDSPGATRGTEWAPCLPEQTRPLGRALGNSLAQSRPEVTQATGEDRGRFFSLWTFHRGRPAKGFAKELSLPHHYGCTSKKAPFTEDKAQRAFLVQCLPMPQPEPLLANHRLPPSVPPLAKAHPAVLGSHTFPGTNSQLPIYTM